MISTLSPEVGRRREELIRRLHGRDDIPDVFAHASSRLRRMIPFDSAIWVTTDPATGFPITPSRIENLDEANPEDCLRYWLREYVDSDFNHFRDLAEADVPAAALRHTAGDPSISARFRNFLSPHGIEDELRVVFRTDGHTWANVTLHRDRERHPFTGDEIELAASLSSPLAETIRSHARKTGEASGPHSSELPGVLLFDPQRQLVSANEEARCWLDELPEDWAVRTTLGINIPVWMMTTGISAQALADRTATTTARARVRTRRNVWLVCHSTVLRDAEGMLTGTAVMIEPAKAADIAPIVVQAYDLSDREQEITRLVARGFGTGEIAARLYLSPHTVRDHVKAILHKVGVSSRGELVATLFADHYWPEHAQGVLRADN